MAMRPPYAVLAMSCAPLLKDTAVRNEAPIVDAVQTWMTRCRGVVWIDDDISLGGLLDLDTRRLL